MTIRNITIIFTLFIIIAIGVFAVPGIPNVYYGDVTVNGEAAQDGLLITAKIDGITLARSETLDGTYGANALSVPADDESTSLKEGGVAGDTVEFYINGVFAGSHEFNSGSIDKLDLFAVLNENEIAASGSGSSGGSSSGSSSGSTSSDTQTGGNGATTPSTNPVNEDSADTPPQAPGAILIKKPVVTEESGLDDNKDNNGNNNGITGNIVSDAKTGSGLSGLTIAILVIAVVLVAAFLFRRKVM